MLTPKPPKHLLRRVTGSPNLADFLNSFEGVRYTIKRYLTEAGLDFSQFTDILDLGCGVGRFALTFEQELRAGCRLRQCDVFEECARWCRENIDFAETEHTSVEPPLPYCDEQFDLVNALSVFTHLRLDLQFKWAWEVHRVLRPGGILFATTHGRLFIPLFYQAYLADAQTRELYSFGEEGLFAYRSSSGNSDQEGQVSVASAQTMEFVKRQFASFELLRAFPQSNLAGEQDLYIFRKPAHGRAIARPLKPGTSDYAKDHSWTGKIGAPPNCGPLSLRFNLRRHSRFIVCPRINVPAVLPLDCQIDVKGIDGLLLNKRVPLNIQRLFGPSHYAVIDVEVPEHDGEVLVDLFCFPRVPSQDDQGVQDVEWSFPHFA
jgi:SAM-dependent methyltransferase